MRASELTGAAKMMTEYDRITRALSEIRDGMGFGMVDSWRKDGELPEPHFKGCEPMKQGRKPLHCD